MRLDASWHGSRGRYQSSLLCRVAVGCILCRKQEAHRIKFKTKSMQIAIGASKLLPNDKLKLRLVKATCLQCGGKKPGHSDREVCGGCGNGDLECSRDNYEPKPKRRSRKSTSADGAEGILNPAETKNTPRQVRNACSRCQHRRSKCSGTRPACTSCV